MSYFRFESFSNLIFMLSLVLAPIAIYLLKNRFKELLKYFDVSKININKKIVSITLIAVAFVALTIALMRPQGGFTQKKSKSLGVEVVILVDVSKSMLAEDIKPSRLEFVKNEISYLLSSGAITRASLIAFAGSSAVLSPLTADLSAIEINLESLSPDSVGVQGTNFKSALMQARNSFFNGGLSSGEGESLSRVLLLFSDGEDHQEGAIKEAKELKDLGVVIQSVLVGTEQGSAIPLFNNFGNRVGYVRDKSGEAITTKAKPEFLKTLAKETDGSFYHFVYGHAGADSLISNIKNMEQSKLNIGSIVSYTEYYQIMLLLAFLILLYVYWKGALLVALICISPLGDANASSLNTVSPSSFLSLREAAQEIKAENYDKAIGIYTNILVKDPANIAARLSLALTYDMLKKYKASEKEYRYINKSVQKNFIALFNYGNSLAAQSRIDDALDAYQEALELNPDSKEVKANIELMMLQKQKSGESDKSEKQDKSGKGGEGQPDPNQDPANDQENDEKNKEKNDQSQKQKEDQQKKEAKEEPNKLSKKDIDQIIEEIKRQEQKVRARELNNNGRGKSLDKSW